MWSDFLTAGFPYVLWVVLPLIPSILIFLIFPTATITAQGPFAGLTVRATGAFAAYLVLFSAMAYPILQKVNENINSLQQRFWVVSGYIELLDAQGHAIRSRDYLKRSVIST